ncbi:methionine synthase [Liquorilactobacillus sucicola DSM 21376 = JCM 15457]|uniref:Methionine synthase n=1 Tax=Liquorilactobacillus sucicola DSM 21376 = JCM 15457 TaxID=1423806 RepID=A0A023CVY7_9LACO|nr:5-methyltetrahydropteroyltriglutamate--homocysteine S-methyltransferase [Liquorilactobacillus sucicola]KRN05645.1 methionine synthase [Liquorilactobacillus sucicola DSM 21376 = JCM 15457]GAJ25731.1 methionine synthase [Liquorilactobacillus sucicola DSM 21376 = JCM 15457]
MTSTTATTFHYDIVGSFLRPQVLKKARADFNAGKIKQEELTKVENNAIKDLVKKEKEVGLKVVTDGEFRRSYWHLDTFWGFEGIEHTVPEHGYFFHDEETRADSAKIKGKISFTPDHPDVKAYKFLHDLIAGEDDVIARQSIPSPAQFYAELVRGEENEAAARKYYPDTNDLIKDIGQAYHDLIIALYDLGCRDVKLDDCTWGMVVDEGFWKEMANGDFDRLQLQQLYLKLNNAALQDLPADLRISTHVCRGNYHSTWAASGGYAPVAEQLFAKENVSAFYLEFDDDRSGDFAPLASVPAEKEVVLGLVTSKNPELEDQAVLLKRIKEAAQFISLENLSLSTQCGFASTEEGNKLNEDQQWAKIKLVIETAQKVWD